MDINDNNSEIVIDYDMLNEQAKSLYDAAYRAGVDGGRKLESNCLGNSSAQGLLSLADHMLANAQASHDDLERARWANMARFALKRTPQMNVATEITTAIGALYGEANIGAARQAVSDAIAIVGKYR